MTILKSLFYLLILLLVVLIVVDSLFPDLFSIRFLTGSYTFLGLSLAVVGHYYNRQLPAKKNLNWVAFVFLGLAIVYAIYVFGFYKP